MDIFKKENHRSRAFTLIEILLVVSLISVIGLAVFRCLANGINIWKYSLHYDVGEDTGIALDKFGFDVRNIFRYSQIPFVGDAQKFSFPTIIRTAGDRKAAGFNGEQVNQIGRVQYYFDPIRSGFYRRQANYSQALKKDKYGPERLLIPSVVSAKFTYYIVTDKKPVVRNKLQENRLPVAVRLDLEIQEDSGGKRQVSQLFNIPIKEQSD